MRTAWQSPDLSPNKNAIVDERDRELFELVVSSATPTYSELLSEANLFEAELSPAVGERGFSHAFCFVFFWGGCFLMIASLCSHEGA